MKKLLASLTILTILALPLGSAASAEQQTPPADLSVEEVHGNIPAQADAAQTMYPAVHSLVLAMTERPGVRAGGQRISVDQPVLYAQPVRPDG